MNTPKLSLTLAAALITTLAVAADPQGKAAKIGERCWQDVKVLADDNMEGRRAGTDAHRRAARFVAEEFRKAGLEPGGQGSGLDAYLQPVQLDMRLIDESKSSLALVVNGETRPLKLGDDAGFNLRGNFAPEFDAPLVFVGHGLVLPDYGVNDLAGLDLKGKVVVAFSTAPASVPGAVGAHFGSAAERWKVYAAAGAVGVVTILNPFTMDLPWERAVQQRLDPFMVLRGVDDQFVGQKAQVMFNPSSFAKLLEGSPYKPEDVLTLLKDGKPMPHFDLAARIKAVQSVSVTAITSENVIGILPGSDPALRDESVVLSGHIDHLGMREGSDADRIYNGALDNAAGI
jgi:hypothetical protein